ncbi:hypothetical protein [Amycolatopsis orientalis]|uniref:hypothetical protein n=1 Tax=Amycolatopsis orientalis TaxID=31958 RepID=UPI0005601DD6|nr:hypothetical protein [Amycolatopsis orientalis]
MTARMARKCSLLLVTLLVLATGCKETDQAQATTGKAKACVQALNLAAMVPDYKNRERDADELQSRADRLRDLAGKVSDKEVGGAVGGLADQYAKSQRNKRETVETFANWVRDTVRNIDKLKQVCIS